MDQEQKKKNATAAEVVAEKFGKLDAGGRAYVLGYLMGRQDEKSSSAGSKTA